MTAKKSTLRQRRRIGAEDMPPDLVAWFEGKESRPPWSALLPGPNDRDALPKRWQTWAAAHPGAIPPQGYEWLLKDAP